MSYSFKVSPQTKTIKYEARPMWETTENIQSFTDKNSKDFERSERYNEVKELLNRYACFVIRYITENLRNACYSEDELLRY